MEFRSVSDLNRAIVKSIDRIPRDIDIVVGIPRSGLLPAVLIALYMHRPVTDILGFLEGRLLSGGERLRDHDVTFVKPGARVLIVDDSILTGSEIAKTKRLIEESQIDIAATYLCVYASPEAKDMVDIYLEIVPGPRIFEWNMFNSWITARSCVDIDGVLCRDPNDEENDDGDRYLDFLTNVTAMIPFNKRLGHIVTSRLEKYRPQTEAWLSKHGIEYDHLHMMNYSSGAERRKANRYSDFKAEIYMDTSTLLFIESSYKQSVEIARKSLKPVYCVDIRKMIYPGEDDKSTAIAVYDGVAWKFRHLAKRARRKLSRTVRRWTFDLLKSMP